MNDPGHIVQTWSWWPSGVYLSDQPYFSGERYKYHQNLFPLGVSWRSQKHKIIITLKKNAYARVILCLVCSVRYRLNLAVMFLADHFKIGHISHELYLCLDRTYFLATRKAILQLWSPHLVSFFPCQDLAWWPFVGGTYMCLSYDSSYYGHHWRKTYIYIYTN